LAPRRFDVALLSGQKSTILRSDCEREGSRTYALLRDRGVF
jgi:hypothetical protein